MKIIYFIIFLFFSLYSYCQENWILYPKKEALDSLNVKSLSNNDSLSPDSVIINKSGSQINIPFINYISEEGSLVENKDSRIDSISKYLAKYGNYKGYTIQIYVTQETSRIREVRKNFISNFPEKTLFDEYIAPNIFLYSGKFKDYNKAELYKKELEEVFKNTLVVRKNFPYKIEKNREHD